MEDIEQRQQFGIPGHTRLKTLDAEAILGFQKAREAAFDVTATQIDDSNKEVGLKWLTAVQ